MMDERKKRNSAQRAARARRRRRRRIRRNLWRVALSLLTVIALVLIAALCAGWVAFRGPSTSMGDLLTVSMLETSALKFVPRIYYSPEQVEQIVARNSVSSGDSETDTSMIAIVRPTPTPQQPQQTPQAPGEIQTEAAPTPTPAPENLIAAEDGIEVYAVRGGTYSGYMMVVQDPSRVSVGTCRDKFNGSRGSQLYEIAQRYNAVAAINGGGFEDNGGVGNGGTPDSLVISGGVRLHGLSKTNNIVVGFNRDDILVVGKMSGEQVEQKNLRDALAFGPALVINGEPTEVKGQSSGLNPRTAIGQRADGAVLMLVIDGRQASSLGATYADLISVMVEYGAVNAVNLDGGSSSLLYYKGDYLNKGVILTGDRDIPTAFVVR